MRRGSFNVPIISDYINKCPKNVPEELELRLYRAWKDKGNLATRDALFRIYARLGASLVANYVPRHPSLVEDLVCEMLFALIDGLEKIRDGALDHHQGNPNIRGYLNQTIIGKLNKYINQASAVNVHRQTHLKLIAQGKEIKKTEFRETEIYDQHDEITEIIEKSCLNAQEKQVVSLRISGLNDVEIGEKLAVSKQRVHQIRFNVSKRIRESLNV